MCIFDNTGQSVHATEIYISSIQVCISTATEKLYSKHTLYEKPVTQQDLNSTALIKQRKTNKLFL